MNTRLMQFRDIVDKRNDERPMGHLTPIEALEDVPFEVKRIYYITRVPENTIRGFHAHKNLEQVLLCLNGSVKVNVSDPYKKEMFVLDDPSKGLYIGPGLWREMFDFSPGSVLLVLASEHYSEDDYIRDYRTYTEYAYEMLKSKQGECKEL
ncbi:sugar 3,4-ketoisomerase [Butyrivibrio sp. FC2001]|uniref:sugar 3,4-ketoisomerase n=1 Tax=Butyrivibrio sp. FC2001 TaxID=1280671 RepID=UPI0004140615|nr:FdtA/QdtA family cupin domain-containing protein [Butyrivibrio sp. FC2001]